MIWFAEFLLSSQSKGFTKSVIVNPQFTILLSFVIFNSNNLSFNIKLLLWSNIVAKLLLIYIASSELFSRVYLIILAVSFVELIG